MRCANDDEAGSVAALIGPENAKAGLPASQFSPIEQLTPEGKPSDEVSLGDMSEVTGAGIDGKYAPDVGSIDGADLFKRVLAFLRRFVSYPSDTSSIAHVLWIGHTHLMDAWFTTPRLAILSPEPGSGKSRLLEITALLVPRPLLSVLASPAYILRRIADQENRPTILYDEIDAVFGPNARGNEDLRAMINAGYRRGAKIGRCYVEKGKVLTEDLATFCAIALRRIFQHRHGQAHWKQKVPVQLVQLRCERQLKGSDKSVINGRHAGELLTGSFGAVSGRSAFGVARCQAAVVTNSLPQSTVACASRLHARRSQGESNHACCMHGLFDNLKSVPQSHHICGVNSPLWSSTHI